RPLRIVECDVRGNIPVQLSRCAQSPPQAGGRVGDRSGGGNRRRTHVCTCDGAQAQVPPRIVGSPTLLTGVLKCGTCGAGTTLATGKGGRYRYYKCNTRIGQGRTLCSARSIPMERLDATVLEALADRVFTPKRVRVMLAELRTKL